MVLSDRSGEAEYFGDFARYVDPGDPGAIHDAVLAAYESTWPDERRSALRDFLATRYSWERYATETAAFYEDVAAVRPDSPPLRPVTAEVSTGLAAPITIVMDITTSAGANIRSGIVRVEKALAAALSHHPNVRVRFVVWVNARQQFAEIEAGMALSEQLPRLLHGQNLLSERFARLPVGSKFLVVGSGWMQNEHYAEALGDFAARFNLEFSLLIHDLTPVLFPHWYGDGYGQKFASDLKLLLRGIHKLLVYSANTQKDTQDVADELDIALPGIEHLRLADGIASADGTRYFVGSNSTADTERLLLGKSYVLSVGGIHVRKNYALLYDVWIDLAERMGAACPHLVIVGGVMWNGAELARAMREDRRVKALIHIIDDVDDAALDWLYRNCLFTAYPSTYEGWGLPVGESLSYGKICLATAASSIPEIAPAATDLLDGTNRQLWAARIQFYAGSATARTAREQQIHERFTTTSWADTANDLIQALSAPTRPVDRYAYAAGDVIRLSDSDVASAYKSGGWGPVERWGTWALHNQSTLRLRMIRPVLEDLVFSAIVKVFMTPNSRRECVVIVNDTRVALWSFESEADVYRGAYIPRELVGPDGMLEIIFLLDRTDAVKALRPEASDSRDLGLGMVAFTVFEKSQPNSLRALLSAPAHERPVVPYGRVIPYYYTSRPLAGDTPGRELRHGWGMMAEDGMLSWLLTAEYPERDLDIELTLRCVASESHPVAIVAFVNGIQVGKFVCTDNWPVLQRLHVPARTRSIAQPANLRLILNAGASLPPSKIKDASLTFSFSVLELAYGFDLDKELSREIKPVVAGTRLMSQKSESSNESVTSCLERGWYTREDHGIWSIGDLGRVTLILDGKNNKDLLAISKFQPSVRSNKPLEVLLDGKPSGFLLPWSRDWLYWVTELTDMSVPDRDNKLQHRFELRFVPGEYSSPRTDDGQQDERVLGVLLHSVEVQRLESVKLGEPIVFAAIAEAFDGQFLGWQEAEELGRWTSQSVASWLVRLPVAEAARQDFEMSVRLRPLVKYDSVAEIEISVNDIVCCEASVGDNSETIIVRIPADAVGRKHGLALICFKTDKLERPIDIGREDDIRFLGILVEKVEFTLAVVEPHDIDHIPSDESVSDSSLSADTD
jgi:glycosyltransferase involved in cell wall biosynthesis